jgi:hypothetical protein
VAIRIAAVAVADKPAALQLEVAVVFHVELDYQSSSWSHGLNRLMGHMGFDRLLLVLVMQDLQ